MALLNTEDPDLVELLTRYQIDLLWHPSLSLDSPAELARKIARIKADELDLTVLCVEGSILTGPEGTGMADTFHGAPKMTLIRELADKAQIVIAVGTCASYGGIPAAPPNPSDAIGLQFLHEQPGGFLGAAWRSRAGLPIINLPGCPVHPATVVQVLLSVLLDMPLAVDALGRPHGFYDSSVHQGCTRNEYHEYDVEERDFGGRGCLFFNLGCMGPLTQATCNVVLWNGQSSKTRAGAPCVGCTMPNFPADKDLFATDKIGQIPVNLPMGVDRANYMSYKGLAKEATPEHLVQRNNQV